MQSLPEYPDFFQTVFFRCNCLSTRMGDRHVSVMQVCIPQAFKAAAADEAVLERYRPYAAAADGTAGVHIKPPFMDFKDL
jgi:hypothetical protein